MSLANLIDITSLERMALRRTKAPAAENAANPRDVSAITAMLDYAVVEGAKMRLPLFVSALRLAQLALREETGRMPEPKSEKADEAASPVE